MARKRHEDEPGQSGQSGDPGDPIPAPRVLSAGAGEGARDLEDDAALRPRSFAEFVGQKKVADNLAVYVLAGAQAGRCARPRAAVGAPRLGKTTLAYLLAREMGSEVRVTAGRRWSARAILAGILTSLGRGDVLFIDEYPPAAAGDRGVSLPGDGGLPDRARHRHRRRRARHSRCRSSASRWSAPPRAPASSAPRCSPASGSSRRSRFIRPRS